MKHFFCALAIVLPLSTALYGQQAHPSVLIDKSRITYLQKGVGSPAVVFVSGMAHGHDTWKAVQDSISGTTMTLSYDRAGLGSSEYHGEKKDITSLANELERVLVSTKTPAPFILVGHSLGCQIIKKYASLHPEKIKGLVFVDPGYNENMLRSRIADSLWNKRNEMIKKYQVEFNAAQEEENANRNQVCQDADKITDLPKVPVVLLTATMVTAFPASAIEQQVKKQTHLLWLKSMPNATHILVDTSWHYIHTDSPGEVVKAIEMVKMSSSGIAK